jgi:U3 small nucleolar ribonucleoprotein protein IMP3
MRQLKYHEQKLLRKHDFLSWSQDDGHREVKIMRRYHIQNRDDYLKYNRLVGAMRHIALRLSKLPATDGFRMKREQALMGKCYDMGLINVGIKMSDVMDGVTVSAFCRRRLGVVMVRLKMSETVKQAVTYIEQGQVRVGPDTITDPAFLVTRNMEDFVSWVDQSRVRKMVARYSGEQDDFDLL